MCLDIIVQESLSLSLQMLNSSLLVFNFVGQSIESPIVQDSLLVELLFRFCGKLIFFAGVEPPPAIKHKVEVTLDKLRPFIDKGKPIPKGPLILHKFSPSVKELRQVIKFFVEVLESPYSL